VSTDDDSHSAEFTFRKPVDGRAAVSHFFGARYQLSKAGAQRAAPSPRLASRRPCYVISPPCPPARPGKLTHSAPAHSRAAFNFTMRRTFPALIWFRSGRTYARRERSKHLSLFWARGSQPHHPPACGDFAGHYTFCPSACRCRLLGRWKISFYFSLSLSRLQGWRGTRALVWGLALVRFSVFSAVFTMNVCGGGLWIVIACGLYGLDSPRIR
jgi:hypothetical protein